MAAIIDASREEIRARALMIKKQFAEEFEARYGSVTESATYFRRVCDFITEKVCLIAAKQTKLDDEFQELKDKLGVR